MESEGVKRSPSHFCSSASPEGLHAQPPVPSCRLQLSPSSFSSRQPSPPRPLSPARASPGLACSLSAALCWCPASYPIVPPPGRADTQAHFRSTPDYPSGSHPHLRVHLTESGGAWDDWRGYPSRHLRATRSGLHIHADVLTRAPGDVGVCGIVDLYQVLP